MFVFAYFNIIIWLRNNQYSIYQNRYRILLSLLPFAVKFFPNFNFLEFCNIYLWQWFTLTQVSFKKYTGQNIFNIFICLKIFIRWAIKSYLFIRIFSIPCILHLKSNCFKICLLLLMQRHCQVFHEFQQVPYLCGKLMLIVKIKLI